MEIAVRECYVPDVVAHHPRSRKVQNETALRSLEGQHAINRAKSYRILKGNLTCTSEICNNLYLCVYMYTQRYWEENVEWLRENIITSDDS